MTVKPVDSRPEFIGEVTWTPGPGLVETEDGVWIAPEDVELLPAPGAPMGPEWIEIGSTDAGWEFS